MLRSPKYVLNNWVPLMWHSGGGFSKKDESVRKIVKKRRDQFSVSKK